jgi:hypothetical protein
VRGAQPANIVVTRERREPGVTFQAYTMRCMLILSRMPDFKLLETGVLEVAGRDALRVHFVSTSERGALEQVIVYVDTPDDMALSITCTAAAAEERPWMPVLESLVASGRLAHASPEALANAMTSRAPKSPPPAPSSSGLDRNDPLLPDLVPMPRGWSRR